MLEYYESDYYIILWIFVAYIPRGAVQLLETMAIALDRRLFRLCRHLSKNMNRDAEL